MRAQVFCHDLQRFRDVQLRTNKTVLDKLNDIEPDEIVLFA